MTQHTDSGPCPACDTIFLGLLLETPVEVYQEEQAIQDAHEAYEADAEAFLADLLAEEL